MTYGDPDRRHRPVGRLDRRPGGHDRRRSILNGLTAGPLGVVIYPSPWR
ncbi:hypothetical protein ACRAWD_23170 [Caulobacter segnis]